MERNEGTKHDGGKPRFSLLPIAELRDLVEVMEFGAEKYGVDNWQKVPDMRTRYFDAAMRHILAWKEGSATDPESGLPHLAHATACLLMLQWGDKNL